MTICRYKIPLLCTGTRLVDENGWRWPSQWLTKYGFLNNIQVPVLTNMPDTPVWLDSKGKVGKYSTKKAWMEIRGEGDKVDWDKLLWYSNCIHRHVFVLWIAIKNKLSTQDKLSKWYSNKSYECSLCRKEKDSHDHLFFNCEYANELWQKVQGKANMNINATKWNDIVKEMSSWNNKKSVWEIIGKLSLAATVYHLWMERNGRLFSDNIRSVDTLFKTITEDIRNRLMSMKAKRSNAVLQVEKVWDVQFQA